MGLFEFSLLVLLAYCVPLCFRNVAELVEMVSVHPACCITVIVTM